jgi:hydrogenase maturation protein HypF
MDSGLRRNDEKSIDLNFVHHHHAHAAALCGEHGRFDQDTLVFTWDGTGLGPDGNLWGGEALLGRPGQWRRVASFRPFPLLGGERAIREPWRMAAALCWEAGIEWRPTDVPEENYSLLFHSWQRQLNAPSCSAVGRLFDAAAALLGLLEIATYDAQAPMLLENLASGEGRAIPLSQTVDDTDVLRCDWHSLLHHLLDTRLSIEQRAADFHRTLAKVLVAQAEYARAFSDIGAVGLSGGVFQNRRLTEAVVEELTRAGFEVLLHERIPCNDAGLSYGQLMHCLPVLRQRAATKGM